MAGDFRELWKRNAPRDSLQHPVSKYIVQFQIRHVDITNMAPAGLVRACRRTQRLLPSWLIDAADWSLDEMASPDRAVTIDGDDTIALVSKIVS